MNLKPINPPDLWYTIGLIVTDGNLSKDGRHINLTSKDAGLLEDVRKALGLLVKIGKKARGREQEKKYYVLQFGDGSFYRYLLTIGLTTKKSLTLAEIKVPNKYFPDFLRGIIDGDGSINTWVNRSNNGIQWCLRLTSGAPLFSRWLKDRIDDYFDVSGKLYKYHYKHKKNPIFITKYGKVATKIILQNVYYKNCLALSRKFYKAIQCLESENGWKKYNTMSVRAKTARVAKLATAVDLRSTVRKDLGVRVSPRAPFRK